VLVVRQVTREVSILVQCPMAQTICQGSAAMKATRAQIQLRVGDLIQFRLDGAQFWHICEYVRVMERDVDTVWFRGHDAKPLSDATLCRYIAKADAQITTMSLSCREKLVRQHLAERRNIYAKAIANGDRRTALAAKDSEAKLLGLFPTGELKLDIKSCFASVESGRLLRSG